jgi:hypothetical protein
MNSGSFKKGQKRPGQGKRGLGRVTARTREAISAFADGNVHRLQSWLDEIHANDGAAAALAAYTRLLEFAVPKQARTEFADQPSNVITVRWAEASEQRDTNYCESSP